jgi:hypothetical protein
LELLVRAATALGELGRAADALVELAAIATTVRTPPLRASACYAEGLLLAAQADHDAARQRFEDAAQADHDAARLVGGAVDPANAEQH